jgi:energy-coupling factor transporter ATP-binding protein EcfA2
MELLEGLVRDEGLAMLVITHDLGLVAQHCSRVCVMYAGEGFDPARFQTTPPVCYRASWQLPGPDSHLQATTSLRTQDQPLHDGFTSCSSGRTSLWYWAGSPHHIDHDGNLAS